MTRVTLLLASAFAVLLTAPHPADAAVPPAPTLSGPDEVVAGRMLSLTATTTATGQGCELLTTSPTGVLRRLSVSGLRVAGTGVRGRTDATAIAGRWTLQLKCGARASQPFALRVLAGKALGRRPSLTTTLSAYAFRGRKPSAWRKPSVDQDAKGAPPFAPERLDGLGASTPERAARALQWALKQVGREDYALWCLRFAANAYNAPSAGYPTAQSAADALDLRGRGGSPASAPAGSLVFFHVAGVRGQSYGHVGLSLGDGRMVSALATVRIDRIKDVALWRENYLGWAWAPAAWPGFPPAAPAAASQAPQSQDLPAGGGLHPAATPPDPPVAPPSGTRIPLVVDNRVTNGLSMVEDPSPLRLQTRPWAYCYSRGCVVPLAKDPGRFSGGIFDAATCQIRGDTMTNGNWGSSADDANPELYTSNLWYGTELADGTFGYLPETWINAAYRGGLGLPNCPPLELASPPASGEAVGKATIAADNRYDVGNGLLEDSEPVRLQTRPWAGCSRRNCMVPVAADPGRFSEGTWDGAVCWTQGDELANGGPTSTDPDYVRSRRWYGVQLDNGTYGYVNEAFVQVRFRGGLGLPYCPPYSDVAP